MPTEPIPGPFVSVQAWARAYILTENLTFKCDPADPPSTFEKDGFAQDLRPGRPALLRVTTDKGRSFKLNSLASNDALAALHHKLWHHELQAAELMCWAMLRFPETPLTFKKGLLRIVRDEIRHMKLYEERINSLGHKLGDFQVRDWFWERVPESEDAIEFVALLGMGLEAANLDHTERFSSWFRSLGDERSAQIQDQVGQEEIAHVRFATHWFKEWTGDVAFSTWCEKIPPPLTPMLMRGKTLHRERRRKANFPDRFCDDLESYQATHISGRKRQEMT